MFFSRLPRNYYPGHNRGPQELSLELQRCVLLKDWTFYLWVEMQFLFPFSSWLAQFLISSMSFSCEGSCTSKRDSKKKLRTLAALRGETCLGNLREEGKDNSEGVLELITPTIEVLFLNRLWVLIFFFLWGNLVRRTGTSFIFVCFLSEQWCPPPCLEQWEYDIIVDVLLKLSGLHICPEELTFARAAYIRVHVHEHCEPKP